MFVFGCTVPQQVANNHGNVLLMVNEVLKDRTNPVWFVWVVHAMDSTPPHRAPQSWGWKHPLLGSEFSVDFDPPHHHLSFTVQWLGGNVGDRGIHNAHYLSWEPVGFTIRVSQPYLVGGFDDFFFMTFHSVGSFIIPTDELHHFSEG